MRENWRILLLGLLVSGAAIFVIASQIDLPLLWDALRGARYGYLLPAGVLTAIGLGARAVRWRVLLNARLPLGRTFHILNISYLLNMMLPFRLGEVARMWLAWRSTPAMGEDEGVPLLQSASTIVVERMLDLLTVVLFIAVALAAGPVPDELRATGIFTGAVALGGFLFLVFLSGQRSFAHRIVAFVVKRLPLLERLNVTKLLDQLLDGLQPLSRPASLASALLWTAIAWGFSLATGAALMLAFYDQIDIIGVLLFIAAASFAVAFPALPGNIGPYEGSIIIALGALGYTQTDTASATVTAFAFTVHFLNLVANAILGIIGFFYEGISLSQLSQGVRQIQRSSTPDVTTSDVTTPDTRTDIEYK